VDHIGPYELLEEISSGGFGRVYRARHVDLDVIRAVKIPTDPELVRQLRREGRVLARLQHPRIVLVYDMDVEHDPPYIVMEYVEGGDLRQRLEEGPLPVERAVQITLDVLEALEHAHNQGVIHRDIKPSNILLDSNGRAKVSDFGLGKVVQDVTFFATQSKGDDTHATVQSVRSGRLMGTFKYMSPEQLNPSLLEGGELDHRSDLYSLGLVFYEILTGEFPAAGWEPPSNLNHSIAPALDDVVQTLLSRRRAQRYADAGVAANAVRGAFCKPAALSVPHRSDCESALSPQPRRRKQHWLRIGGLAAFVALVALWGLTATKQGKRSPSRPSLVVPANERSHSSSTGNRGRTESSSRMSEQPPPTDGPGTDDSSDETSQQQVSEQESGSQGGSESTPRAVSIIVSDQAPRVAGDWNYLGRTTSIGYLVYDGYAHLGSFEFCTFDVRDWEWFTAFIGVPDDGFGDDSGLVTVAVDGAIVWQVSKRRGERATRAIIDLRGKQALTIRREGRIIFAEPKLVKGLKPLLDTPSDSSQRVPVRHTGEQVIDDETPTTAGGWNHRDSTVSIGGVLYDDYGHLGDFDSCTFDVRGWDWLSGYVGVPEDTFGGSGRLKVLVDGELVWQQARRKGERAAHLVVDLRGRQTLTLIRTGRIVLARPRLVKGPRP